MSDDDNDIFPAATLWFPEMEQHKLLDSIKQSAQYLYEQTGQYPTRIVVDKNLYINRIKFMEKAINELGIIVEVQ